MPPPNPESDLKRRARRRLIGAVALMLLAVIVLPLLLEDEPPPASNLNVKMAEAPGVPVSAPAPAPSEPDTAVHPDMPVDTTPVDPPPPPVLAPKPPDPKPAVRPVPATPVAKPPAPEAAKPVAAKPKPEASAAFVVQLAALSDASKTDALVARARKLGLATYTDKRGTLTRVRVGPFASRTAAVEAAVKLAEAGLAGQVVAQ